VDVLSLALGSRAESDLIRAGEKEAVVQAYFEVEGGNEFPDIGIDISDGILLRRSISATGKSRAYINDTIVNLQSPADLIFYGSEGSCVERLSSIIPKVREISSIDQSVSDTLKMLESVLPLIEDAAISLRRY